MGIGGLFILVRVCGAGDEVGSFSGKGWRIMGVVLKILDLILKVKKGELSKELVYVV